MQAIAAGKLTPIWATPTWRLLRTASGHGVNDERVIAIVAKQSRDPGRDGDSYWANSEAPR